MNRKKRIALLLIFALLAAALTGCGIVKIIPAGTESDYTGVKVFDASAVAAGDWTVIQEEIIGKAVPLSELVSAGLTTGTTYCASFAATVTEYNTDSPKGYLLVMADGVYSDIQVQVGSVFSGTTVRDAQTNKIYEDFTNQTEWSAYAKTINTEVQINVIDPLGNLSSLVGKSVQVVGCLAQSGDTIVVTPVSLIVQ